jgi:hypothetical protein
VQRIGQDDVHRLDGRVVAYPVETFIAVQAAGRDVIHGRHTPGFIGIAADQGRHFATLGAGQRREDFLQGQPTQSDDRDAQATVIAQASRHVGLFSRIILHRWQLDWLGQILGGRRYRTGGGRGGGVGQTCLPGQADHACRGHGRARVTQEPSTVIEGVA